MRKLIFIAVIFLLLLSMGCDKNGKTVIAQVNNDILTLEDLQNSMPKMEYEKLSKDEKRDLINNWIELTLISQKADEDDLLKDNSIIKFKIENAKKKIKANAYINKHLQTIKVSEEELFNYYRLHRGDYKSNSIAYKVQRIYFKNYDDMNKVKTMLDAQEILFTPAAMKYSEEGIGTYGGYMSEPITADGTYANIYEVIKPLEKYRYTTMPYSNGYIIVRYYDEVEIEQETTFDEAKDEIINILRNEKRIQIYNNMIKNIKAESNITTTF
ncbi:MAG: hypothetical protein RBS92_04265 [Candidatus Cloacimonadales bacterium]|jgi:hypothetical protein|nr:hypothetical protein [Candidatus Cloacimonadales bacterium]